ALPDGLGRTRTGAGAGPPAPGAGGGRHESVARRHGRRRSVNVGAGMSPFDAVFKAYDIRGTVPEQLDEAMCRAVGAAFARFAAAPRILIGHDMRPSGDEVVGGFSEGARRQGVDVTHLGLVSTDLVYYAAGKLDAPGVMFTAS